MPSGRRAPETLAPPLRRPTTNECIQYELLDLSVSRLHNKFIISVQSVYTSIGLDLALFDRKSRQCRAYINTGQSAEIFSSLNISVESDRIIESDLIHLNFAISPNFITEQK